MPCSPLPRRQKRKWLDAEAHALRVKKLALKRLRKARAGTYRPARTREIAP